MSVNNAMQNSALAHGKNYESKAAVEQDQLVYAF